MSLVLRVLGNFEVKQNGQTIAFPTEKSRLLLAYLALHTGTPFTRAHVAEILWPDRPEKTARHSLRTELNRLKQTIDDTDGDNPILRATRTHIEFASSIPGSAPGSTGVTVDAHLFQQHVDSARTHQHDSVASCEMCRDTLQKAVGYYRGNFLADVVDSDSEELARWRQETRRRFEHDMLWAFDALVEGNIETNQPQVAIQLAQRQIQLTPWYERAHCNLMHAFTLAGRRSAALRQFETLTHILDNDLAAEPSAETVALFRQISADTLPVSTPQLENPYQGLQAFGSTAAPRFFGRENATSRLYEAVQVQPFLALIGPSGSGKSSVVQAGLIPQLGEGWEVVTFRPGADPFRNMQEATAFLQSEDALTWQWTDFLSANQDERQKTLAQVEALCQQHRPNTATPHRCLFVVDQFEEIFTQCDDPDVRLRFFELLLALTQQQSHTLSITVLIALRADFMAQALAAAPLTSAFQDATIILGAMNRSELRRAIERPALRQGVTFEPGLVDRLLDDVGSEPGNLPLLQFALTLLWQEQQDGWLTHQAYDDLERVVGALTHYASGIYARLDPEAQHQAQRIFLQLIQPGQGTADTRRTATRVEIGEADWRLAQHLADRRLVVTNRNANGDETVEIVHEALINEWDLLQRWMETDREFRLWQQRIRLSLSQWQRSAEDPGTLLRGGPLAEAERWMQARGDELSRPLCAFIEASIGHRQRSLATQEEQRRREFEQMQALAQAESQRAESEAKSSQRLRILASGMAVAFFLALLAAIFAFQSQQTIVVERNRAEENARIALARQLSAQAVRNAGLNIDLALLLGRMATDIGLPAPDRAELFTELTLPPMLTTVLREPTSPVLDMVFNPTNNTLFVRGDKGSVHAWDLSQPDARPVPLIFEDETIREVMFSVQGDRMAVNRTESVELWDLTTLTPVALLNDHDGEIISLGYSYDGRYLATSDRETMLIRDAISGEVVKSPLPFDGSPIITLDGTTFVLAQNFEDDDDPNLQHIVFWNIETDERHYDPSNGHTSNVHSFRFSPDGRKLVTASFDGTVVLWDVESGLQIGDPLRGHDGRVLIANFSKDGNTLVSGGVDGVLLVWDIHEIPKLKLRLNGHGNWVRSVTFTHDGAQMATGDSDGTILLWQADARQVLAGHQGRARTVDVSPDGKTVISAGFDTYLGVWDAENGDLLHLRATGRDNAVSNAIFSPDGNTAVSIDGGGTVIFWDTQTWMTRTMTVGAHQNFTIAAAFSADGATLATGDFGGVIRLWDVASGEPIGDPLQAHNWWVLSLAFSPDGKILASGGSDATIKLWDTLTQTQIGDDLTGHTYWVTDLLFTPDGAQLVSAGGDHTIRVWDVASGQAQGEPILGHHAQVWTIQFFPPGTDETLVSADTEGKILRWDWQTRLPLGPALRTNVKTESMSLSPDGTFVYLGSFDPTIHRWDLPWLPWEEQVCAIANRALNEEEVTRYLHDEAYPPACAEEYASVE